MYSYNTVIQFVSQCNILLLGSVLAACSVLILVTLRRKSLTPHGAKNAHTVLMVQVSIMLYGIANLFYSFPSVLYNGSYWQQVGSAGDQAVAMSTGNGMSNATVAFSYPISQVYCKAVVPPGALLDISTAGAGFFYAMYSVLQDLLVIRLFSIIAGSRSLSSGDNLNLLLSRGNVIFIIVLFLCGVVATLFNNSGLAVIIGSVALWCTAGFSFYLCRRIRLSLVTENLAGVKQFVSRVMLVRGTDFLVFTMSGLSAYMLQPQVGNNNVININYQQVMVQCSGYSLVFSVIPILYLPIQVINTICQVLLTYNAQADVGSRTQSSSVVPGSMISSTSNYKKHSHQQASNKQQQVQAVVVAHSSSAVIENNDAGPAAQ